MNDPMYNSRSHVLPELHNLFAKTQDHSYKVCMLSEGVNADQVKIKMSDL